MANNKDNVTLAVLKNDLTYVKETVKDINNKLTRDYATKDELVALKDTIERRVAFLEKIVFSFIGIILVTVIGAWLGLVIIKPYG